MIYDEKRRDVATLSEPYNEGSNINLICEAEGGECLPAVSNSSYNVSIKNDFATWKQPRQIEYESLWKSTSAIE